MDDPDILLVEDNPGDVRLIEKAFDERDLPGTVHSVQTGTAALDWLRRHNEHSDAPRPDIVLLDLNLPGTSGHAVLEEIKGDPALKRIPVIVLTGSESETDLIEVYAAHANACLIKPVDPTGFIDLVEALVDFWVSTAELPPGHDASTDARR